MMQGFLNLNKPYGFTSHDCVAKGRRLLKLKRVGHGGTLDPMATGVLPIAFGKATRLLQYLRQDKAYQATIRFGVTTTTDDLEGEVVETKSAASLTQEAVEVALKSFLGKITQIPPQYSAIQVQGQRLYDLARKGEVVEVPARVVEVSRIDVLGWKPGEIAEVEIAIACGSGTYIRAIARDLGNQLGTGGTLAALTRTASCGFSLSDSLTLEDLERHLQAGTFTPISPTAALEHLNAIALSPTDAKAWCQGKRLPYSYPHDANPLRIHSEDGQFLGIGQLTHTPDQLLIPQMVYEPA